MKKTIGLILGLSLVLMGALIGCASAVADGQKLGKEFTLPIGQSVSIPGKNMTIEFDAVTADSRSPIGAETIWAGEAKMQLQITYQGVTNNITLTEKGNTRSYSEASFNQYKMNFQLKPYPEVGKQPAQSEYQLLMKVTR